MWHVDEGTLHAYLDGALEAGGSPGPETVEAHVQACAECAARLEEAARLHERARAILRTGAPEEVPIPEFDQIRARTQRTRRAAPSRRRWVPPLAWAASVVLAVAAGWSVRGALLGPEVAALTSELGPAGEPSPAARVAAERAAATVADSGEAAAVVAAAPAGQAAAEREPTPRVEAPGEKPPPALEQRERLARAEARLGLEAGARAEADRIEIAPTTLAAPAVEAADRAAAVEAAAGKDSAQARLAEDARSRMRAEAARVPPPTLARPGASGALSAARWIPVDESAAVEWLDAPLVRAEALPIAGVAIARVEGVPVARAIYALEAGRFLELFQWREPAGAAFRPAHPAAMQEPEMLRGEPGAYGFAILEARREREAAVAILARGADRVLARAAVPMDSLRALAGRVR